MPGQGVGGNGTASEFGDLTGMSRREADEFLRSLGATIKITKGGYIEYKFADASVVMIRPNGEVIRTPAPKYNAEGQRINKGLRLDQNGCLLQTRDNLGNLLENTHQTGERLNEELE
ncbi:conserved hypothetical protein [Planktothrix serta PCC 8927]|uniref:Uncharacterized protein n=1 Tax=Planktothrix serta PCC 8927 TaxID=671068 RepID=A0A7Z9DWR7_9CYAN|nr:hypothetical protein [Planktothrix serta]VXD15228.1 conserved hypothetical protein [Planktothrix serta PCC 8927]